jgi:hypothetical protein
MIRRAIRLSAVALLLMAFAAQTQAAKKYAYGRYSSQQAEQGFFVLIEVGSGNPRNTDNVVATIELVQDFPGGVNQVEEILPVWGDDLAGRFTAGYAWANGNTLSLAFWGFETDTSAAGNGPGGGTTFFAIGPPIFTGGSYVDSGSPGYFNIGTTVEASTIDLTWARSETFGESWSMQWSVGLRYALFTETYDGIYDESGSLDPTFGNNRYVASKENEGEMFGARLGVTGSYKIFPRLSMDGRLAFSLLDGEIVAHSSLVPTGLINSGTMPSSFASAFDDGRSGSIVDFGLAAVWHSSSDAWRISLGWEQSTWNGIVSDLVRNFPGTSVPLRDRDSVVFSAWMLGFYARF